MKSNEDQAPAFTRLESLTALIVVGVLALALGLVALVKPAEKSASKSVPYTQSGTFGYSAKAQGSSLYGPGGLSTGQPILIDKVGPVAASFRYKLSAKTPASVHGTASMDAKVSLSQGLSRTFPVTAKGSFTGAEVSLAGSLPVDAIANYVQRAQNALQDGGISSATIVLRPRVNVQGSVGTHALKTTYAPKLPFTLNGTTLVVGQGNPDPTATSASDPLKPSKDGKLTYRATAPNTLSLLVIHPSVTLAREIGFGLAGLCLVLGLVLARPLLRSGDRNEAARIHALYGAHLIEVRELSLKDGPIAEVASMDALADLAKKYESMVMHIRRDDGDAYLLWDNGMLYRYRPARPEQTELAPPTQNGAVLTKPLADKVNGVSRR